MSVDWPSILAEHGPAVWRTARRVLGDDTEAADCFQDTFVAALELSARQEVRNWSAVLRRIASCRAVDRLRQRSRHERRIVATPPDSTFAKEADPGRHAEATELADRLRDAIARLPDLQAQVFCLRSVEQMRYDEIADALGLTVNHVGVLLKRARAGLKELLDGDPPRPAPAAEPAAGEVQP